MASNLPPTENATIETKTWKEPDFENTQDHIEWLKKERNELFAKGINRPAWPLITSLLLGGSFLFAAVKNMIEKGTTSTDWPLWLVAIAGGLYLYRRIVRAKSDSRYLSYLEERIRELSKQ